MAELLGVYYTGGSLNPARSFGPSVVLGEFEGYREYCHTPMRREADHQTGSTGSVPLWARLSLPPSTSSSYVPFLAELGQMTDDQKFLQYETVLGPEDGETAPMPTMGSNQGDEEKNIGSSGKDTSVPISGPGLGDLHTVGENSDVSLDISCAVNIANEVAIRIGTSYQLYRWSTRQD